MFGSLLYLRNAAPSTPVKRVYYGPAYEMRKAQEKRGKEREKGGKMRDQIVKKREYLHAQTFSHCDPAPWTFVSVKFLQCSIVKNNKPTFVFQ